MNTEELNQVQETEVEIKDDDSLFDDFEVEETTEAETEPNEEVTEAEESNSENTEVEETAEVEETPQEISGFLNVKYNGEEMTLNEEDARMYAQKGLNYDRIYVPLERLARLNNLSVGEYLNRLDDTQIQFEVSKEVNALKQNPKYENVSDEVLEEIAHNRVMETIGQKDRDYEESQKELADTSRTQAQIEIDKFMEEYPEFKNKGPEALDPAVFDYVKQGYTLLEAYNKWSRQQANLNKPQLDAKEKSAKLNEENKKKSLGNTTNAGDVKVDDFMNGFLNG